MANADPQHVRLAEAILFASPTPVAEHQLDALLPEGADLAAIVAALVEHYRDRGVRLVRVGDAWAFRTAPDVAAALTGARTVVRKLSRAAIETLAIVAYHQPVTRAEIEDMRGVSLGKGTFDALFDEGWIAPQGRRESPGRPITWGTTTAFLDHFGLSGLEQLPSFDELKAAGLLDSRPAILAYAERESVGDVTADEQTDPGRPSDDDQDNPPR